jgi:hypothetical protein
MLKAAYGITIEQKEEMSKAQGGKCKICGVLMTCAHVDHNHTTGKVRGLLCYRCNHALGLFKDSIQALESAAAYLKSETDAAHGG